MCTSESILRTGLAFSYLEREKQVLFIFVLEVYQLRVLLSQRWIRLQLTDVSTFQGVDTLVPTTVNIVTVLLSSSFRVTIGTTYVSSTHNQNLFHPEQHFSNLFISISRQRPPLRNISMPTSTDGSIHNPSLQTVVSASFPFLQTFRLSKKRGLAIKKKSAHAISRNTNVRLIC